MRHPRSKGGVEIEAFLTMVYRSVLTQWFEPARTGAANSQCVDPRRGRLTVSVSGRRDGFAGQAALSHRHAPDERFASSHQRRGLRPTRNHLARNQGRQRPRGDAAADFGARVEAAAFTGSHPFRRRPTGATGWSGDAVCTGVDLSPSRQPATNWFSAHWP